MSTQRQMRLMSPTGHLGFTPIERGSFEIGLRHEPDAIVADSGSCDIGPYPLGSDQPHSPREWQMHDIELIVRGARELGIPAIIGSASDTGTDRGVDDYVAMVREVVERERLGPVRVAAIYSEIDRELLRGLIRDGVEIAGLNGRPPLDEATLDRTDRIVGVMGAEPIIDALNAGAEIIITGRASDSAIFAAPALRAGYPKALAYCLGKLLECASFCAEPYMGKETVIGTITDEELILEPMHPGQRCTPASVAGHAMYERIDPFTETVSAGSLDLRGIRYEAIDERRTRVTGPRFIDAPRPTIKLEGAGKVGERALAIMGIRDPITLSYLDEVIAFARRKVEERFGPPGQPGGYELFYHVFGRNGVMGYLEPTPEVVGHEVGVVVEAVAPTRVMADEIAALGSRNMFYARLPVVKGTAGGASFFSDEVLAARPGYQWTVAHVLPVDDPRELFRTRLLTVGG